MKITTDKQYTASRPELLELISPDSRKILDVGCADGHLSSFFRDQYNAEVWGVEISHTMADKAKNKMDRVLVGPIENFFSALPDKYFDTIILADILEHLIDPCLVLLKLRGKLTDNGAFVASIPNVGHWGVIKNLLKGIWRYTDYGLMDSSHLRWFTRQTIYEMFNSVGLHIKVMSVTLTDYENIPESFLRACQNIGIDSERLKLESQVFQYLIQAVDLNRIKDHDA